MADSRTEALLQALVNGDTADIVPQSRNEAYLLALINGDTDVPDPRSRMEAYLYALCQNGTGGGSGGGGDNPLDYAHYMTSCASLFQLAAFESGTEIEMFIGKNTTNGVQSLANFISQATGVKSVKIECNPQTKAISLQNFANMTADEYELISVDFSNLQAPIGTMTKAFAWRRGLVEILGELDCTNTTSFSSCFINNYALTTIAFKANTIKVNIAFPHSIALSDDSIQSIIDGLADLTDGTAQTLTLHSDIVAKITTEQVEQIEAKNWAIG